jgi:hypothetical protein
VTFLVALPLPQGHGALREAGGCTASDQYESARREALSLAVRNEACDQDLRPAYFSPAGTSFLSQFCGGGNGHVV